MRKFDEIFAILPKDDDEKLRRLGYSSGAEGLSDAQVETLVAER